MGREEVLRLEAYLKEKLNPGLRLIARKETDDSVEVYLGAEFLAVVYKDVDDGETSYALNKSLLSTSSTTWNRKGFSHKRGSSKLMLMSSPGKYSPSAGSIGPNCLGGSLSITLHQRHAAHQIPKKELGTQITPW